MHEISLFEAILNTNIINFIIVIYTLALIYKKAHLGDLIAKMADEVRLSVEKSTENKEKALKEYEETKELVSDTQQLQDEIKSQAKLSAENIKRKTEEKTVLQQKELLSHLERIFKSQAQRFKNLTLEDVYSASINLAKEEVLARLDEKIHKKLINSSIDELDKIKGNLS